MRWTNLRCNGLARAGDQTPLLQAIEQSRDIRIARDHAIRDFAAGKPLGIPAQDSQYVVLAGGAAQLRTVFNIVQKLAADLVTLAHEGTNA